MLPRHGVRATNYETLAKTAGLRPAIAPDIAGFFINACLYSDVGGFNETCRNFRKGAQAVLFATKFCGQLRTTDKGDALSSR
jgi:hypothetical protein